MPYYFIIPAAVVAVAYLGARFTTRGLGPWYDGLKKPSWTPPGTVISAAWFVIYTLTGMSAIVLWQRATDDSVLLAAALLFIANGALNAGWCYVFFARRAIDESVAVIFALEATVLGLIALLRDVAPLSAWLLVPYAAWAAFAAALNVDIARRNRGRSRR